MYTAFANKQINEQHDDPEKSVSLEVTNRELGILYDFVVEELQDFDRKESEPGGHTEEILVLANKIDRLLKDNPVPYKRHRMSNPDYVIPPRGSEEVRMDDEVGPPTSVR